MSFCLSRLCRPLTLPCAALTILMGMVRSADGEVVEGFAEPYRAIDVSGANEPDLITEILVRDGDPVSKGQVIAAVDTSVLEASLEIAKRRSEFSGQILAAEAEFNLRRERASKLQLLLDRGHASPLEVERAKADADIAAAQLKLAREERELASLECKRIKAQIERRRFRSPIDGVVTEVVREVGEAVQISDPRLMTVVQLNPLRVKFPVAASRSAEFSAGDTINVGLPETADSIDATVEMIAPVVDPKSGTVDITCVIANPHGDLRSGMRCLLVLSGEAPYETDDPLATDYSSPLTLGNAATSR